MPIAARARMVAGGEWSDCLIGDASVSGALLVFPDAAPVGLCEAILVDVPQVGLVDGRVVRLVGNALGVNFEYEHEDIGDNLIRFLYTAARRITLAEPPKAASLITAVTKRFFGPDLLPYLRGDKPT